MVDHFLSGIAIRFVFGHAAWSLAQIARAYAYPSHVDGLRRVVMRVGEHWKMWVATFALDWAAQLLVSPHACVVASHAGRSMLDAFAPTCSRALAAVDGFSHAAFIGFAASHDTTHRLSQSAASAFLWPLPATAIAVAKLLVRVRVVGWRHTRFYRCLFVALIRHLARVPLLSFAVMLPMSDAEISVAALCLGLDWLCTNYLNTHTWPFAVRRGSAGASGTTA